MSQRVKSFLKTIPIQHVWIFLTEKCQLDCDYCFFQDRRQQRSLTWPMIERLFQEFSSLHRYDIVFSGGEPLLVWDLFVKSVQYIKRFLPKSIITLQTNCLLLDEEKCIFLKNNNISVEPGIDGLLSSHLQHRKSMMQDSYPSLVKNIQMLRKHHILMAPTMTVHPQEVGSITANFRGLIEYGLGEIEVHPAFLAPWEEEQKQVFLKQYRLILIDDLKHKGLLIGKDYSVSGSLSVDLVILPSGEVFPNWTYLTFPINQRKFFALMCLFETEIVMWEKNTQQCLMDLRDFFLQPKTYRECSCFHAERVLKRFPQETRDQQYQVYKSLCAQIQVLDQQTHLEHQRQIL